MDTIARAGDIDGGIRSGRKIKEAEGDGLKKLFRADNLQRENNMARKLFRQSVVEIFGGESKIPKSVKDAMRLKDYDQGKPLTVRRILAVKAAIDVYAARAADALDRAKEAATQALFYGNENNPVSPEKRAQIDRAEEYEQEDREAYLKKTVAGNGRGANKVRAVFSGAMPPPVFNPADKFKSEMSNNARGIINRTLCRKLKGGGFDGYRDANFQYNLANQRIGVTLPGGAELSQNPDEAYNKLASFITKGAKSTVDALDGHERRKFLILISLMDENSRDIAEKGGKLTLDPNGRDDGKFKAVKQNGRCQFTLSLGINNALIVKCEMECDLRSLSVKNDQGAMENVTIKPGSKLTAGHVVKIPDAELDRLADLDFTAYDDGPVQQRLNDPNVAKPYHNIKPTFGNGFGFSNTVEVATTFKLTVN